MERYGRGDEEIEDEKGYNLAYYGIGVV